jgi:3-hydroxybutyryl-CoA dehydrogenase
MGHGIALVMAKQPGAVWLCDLSAEVLVQAQERMHRSLEQLARFRLVEEVDEILARIRTTTDLAEAVGEARLVVEAVPEDLALKQKLFAELERLAPADAILATNSSGLPIAESASDVQSGWRVVGSHFFLPAQIMPLVEVSRGPETSEETMQWTYDHWRSCGKEPIRIERDIPGYVANRMQGALVREATSLLAQGVASAEDIDKAVRMGFGLRFLVSGPLEQRDLGGLDLHLALAGELWPHLDCSSGPFAMVREKVERGELGLKTGQGFYDWSGQDEEGVRNEKDEALLKLLALLDR